MNRAAPAYITRCVTRSGCDAANIIAKHGLASPSSKVDKSLYGPVMQTSANAVATSKVQFVMGDLLPGDLVDEYRVQLQKFLQDPSDANIDAVSNALEAKAATFNDKAGTPGSWRTDFGVSPAAAAPGDFASTHHVSLRRSYLKAGSDQVLEEVYDLLLRGERRNLDTHRVSFSHYNEIMKLPELLAVTEQLAAANKEEI